VGAAASRSGDGGSGLGVAISRAAVEARGGRIRVVDEPAGDAETGARVRFSLPAAAAAWVRGEPSSRGPTADRPPSRLGKR
jgi:signal transduction histidine kinase